VLYLHRLTIPCLPVPYVPRGVAQNPLSSSIDHAQSSSFLLLSLQCVVIQLLFAFIYADDRSRRANRSLKLFIGPDLRP
jgi:hypothetical protein